MSMMGFVSWRDLLDILVVTLLLYRVILMIRGTRLVSALTGLMLLAFIYGGARLLNLYTLSWLLEGLFGSLFLMLVILFHDDIRQGLVRMGASSLWRRSKDSMQRRLEDLQFVCEYCARKRIGALIVVERGASLGDLAQTGVHLDAELKRELLLTIFYPGTALHDGAVIVRGNRIVAAGCILPLARVDRQAFGTRHRAALGVTETCDAVAIVVSEERGAVSVARGGRLSVVDFGDQLKETLSHVLEK